MRWIQPHPEGFSSSRKNNPPLNSSACGRDEPVGKDGTFITSNQESQIEIFATTNLALGFTNWMPLTNAIQLTNGFLQINDTNSVFYPQRFYRAVETP